MKITLTLCLLAVVVIAILISPLAIWSYNRPRVQAQTHLRRNQRTSALLDTWKMPPSQVLKSFPGMETVIGVKRRSPRWMEEMTGFNIINARLVGPKVNDSDLRALAYFPECEYLELISTNVSDLGVVHLQRALPNLQIVRR